jgi:GT2 family glycosyltransferase
MSLRVSVVVPTFRRPKLLERCLRALEEQTLAFDEYEVLVADDAASEETRLQVQQLAASINRLIRYLPVSGSHGPAAARNVGWRAARAPLVAFTDDDTIPDPAWLLAGVEILERQPALAAVTGQIVVPLPQPPTDYQRNEAGLEQAEFVTANCFCRREVLNELGGFDERFTAAWREDSDLHFRLLEGGHHVMKVPEAVVVHPVRPARWGVSLRMQRKSLFDALLYKKHPALYRRHIRRSPPLDYYGMVVSFLAALAAAFAGAALAFVVVLTAWAVLLARFLSRRLRGNSRAPAHVAEMVFTSLFIPFLSVFWRLYGAARFRVLFM